MTDLLHEALVYAAVHSNDPRTKVGVVLQTGRRLVYAANATVAGPAGDKYTVTEHAERAAIYKAAAAGVPTAGATLYAPWFACQDCARAIVLAGIGQVVGLQALADATPERWRASVEAGVAILRANGVGVRWVTGTVGAEILFDGRRLRC